MGRKQAKPPKTLVSIAGIGGPAISAASPVPVAADHKPSGRPQGSTSINYADIDPLIDFWHLHPGAFTQKTLIDLIRHLYKQKYVKAPWPSTIKARIENRKPKRK
jgi:hypothetical protein